MILVIDVGTSSVRVLVVDADGITRAEHRTPTLPTTPAPGLVEFDPVALADVAIALAETALSEVTASGARPIDAVAITNQRASTVVWDAATGDPVGPGIGWQDLRTVGHCLQLRAEGIVVAPNLSATKAAWLVDHSDIPADRLRIGTIDTWLTHRLTQGAVHATDPSNAAVTGLFDVVERRWDLAIVEHLGLPPTALADVVDTMAVVGHATALTGAPPIAALVADQQASLVGQGAIEPGMAKITFGTGAMLDVCVGTDFVAGTSRGTFPIIAWQDHGRATYGLEAVDLAAGSAVEWLRDGLGLISTAAESGEVAATVPDSDGVVFVPSLSGTGTPEWDHGARGLLIGVTRGTTRAHVVRAVLEGVAHRGADLVDTVEGDTGRPLDVVRVDGGMAANPVFVQAFADAAGRPVAVSRQREATALGAGFLAGVAVGQWPDLATATTTIEAPTRITPGDDRDRAHVERARFHRARARAGGWIPALSDLDL